MVISNGSKGCDRSCDTDVLFSSALSPFDAIMKYGREAVFCFDFTTSVVRNVSFFTQVFFF